MHASLSFWEKQTFLHYDIIIIGSGIVGLSASIFLKEKHPGWKIAVLERGFLPSGASTKNAGFACFGSISELAEQEKRSGTEGLHALIEKRWKGLLSLRSMLGDRQIDYRNLGGYELFNKEDAAITQESLAKIDHFNLVVKDIVQHAKAFYVSNEKIKDFGFGQVETLIGNRFEGQIDTGKMMLALMQKAMAAGVLLFNHCDVQQIETNASGIRVYTPTGNFQCRKVLLTTNAFTRRFLKDIDLVPGRGQVLITEPLKTLPVKGAFHYNKGYVYFRNIGSRLLLGGGRNLAIEEETTTELGTTSLIQDYLEELLREMILPGAPFKVADRWSGIMAFGSQISPIIKRIDAGIYCAVRGSGMGVAMGTQTGRELAELVYGTS